MKKFGIYLVLALLLAYSLYGCDATNIDSFSKDINENDLKFVILSSVF
ncbi:hypothetical protein [Pumilibacter intestinalis]|nr:hypothetical protein [Pumilibacter intestinalis]